MTQQYHDLHRFQRLFQFDRDTRTFRRSNLRDRVVNAELFQGPDQH